MSKAWAFWTLAVMTGLLFSFPAAFIIQDEKRSWALSKKVLTTATLASGLSFATLAGYRMWALSNNVHTELIPEMVVVAVVVALIAGPILAVLVHRKLHY
jgi:hypothetical protein